MAQEQESFSFVKTEHKVLSFWEKEDIFKKTLAKTEDKAPYIFYDGPPFATGLPHHGHLVGNTLKDIVPRYFTMKGRYVDRRFGWDCHGLPIEHEIDKKLGMSAQDAVLELGLKGYSDECRGIVQRYTTEWRKTITRLGRWVDFDNDYKTMDTNFMESVWWAFKQLWDKDLIYEGNMVMPFSTALQTVLSNFEAGQNYQDVQDPAVTVLFKAKGEDYYFAAWTTTPWTLPSNLGLCVNANLDYALVHDEEKDQKIVFAKARLEGYQKKNKLKVLKEFKGSELKGQKYEPLFAYFADEAKEGAFQIFNDDYVTTDAGTGVVHLAPAFGEDDNRVFKEAGVSSLVCPIDKAGNFTDEVSDFKGKYLKDADKEIIKNLKERSQLFEQSTYVHSYPMCWRSDTPLIYRTIPSWYVKVEQIKDRLLKSNDQINWTPSHIKEGRFGKWLEGARDWSISRNRFWGTPLPIWHNETIGKHICIGSIEELEKYSGVKVDDLHRENVDNIAFKVDGEEGEYKRISEVLDCWFESGSMPYAQIHYPFENKELFEAGFPAAYIAEGLDQTRGWFYTLTVLSTAIFDKPAFKNVIVNGIVNTEDGKKMSKRLKNYTEPDLLMEEYGADAFRLYLITSGLVKGENLRFSDVGVKDMVRRALLPWYNAFKFFDTYAQVDGWTTKDLVTDSENITDRWVLSKLQTLIKNVNTEMDEYHLYNVVPALFDFIEDLTNWYIRLNRRRFWEEGLELDKKRAYSTLYTTIDTLGKLMAPFAPFLSEHIFSELKRFNNVEELSVHLCSYPESNEKLINSTLEDAMGRMQQIILLGRGKRNDINVKVKTPLASLTIIHKDQVLLDEIQKLASYVQSELNIKEIRYSTDEEKYIDLKALPNSPILGPKLGKEFGKYRGMITKLSNDDLLKLESTGKVKIADKDFSSEEILVHREAKEGTQAVSNKLITIDIDCTLTDELILEGLAREVVNRIQRTRKDIGLNVADRIKVQYQASAKIGAAIEAHKDYIAKETLSLSIIAGVVKTEPLKIDGEDLSLQIER